MNRRNIEIKVDEEILDEINLSDEVKDKFKKVFVDVVEVKAKEYARLMESTDLKEMSESILVLTETNAHLKEMYMKLLNEHSSTLVDDSITESSMYNTPKDNEIANSNALYLSGTQIGTRTGDYYQLYSDIDEQLPDDVELDFDELGRVIAHPKHMMPLVKAVHLSRDRLQALNESNDPEPVEINALNGVKKLESVIELYLRNGDLETAKEAIDELNNLVNQYNNAVPPAEGIGLIALKIKDYEKVINEKRKKQSQVVESLETKAKSIMANSKPMVKNSDSLIEKTMALLGEK